MEKTSWKTSRFWIPINIHWKPFIWQEHGAYKKKVHMWSSFEVSFLFLAFRRNEYMWYTSVVMFLQDDPHDLHLLAFTPCVVPSCVVLGLVCETSDLEQKWWLSISQSTYKRLHLLSWLFFSFSDHSLWGKSAAVSWRHSGHLWRCTCGGKGSLWTTVSEELRPANNHMSELGTRFSGSSQALIQLQLLPTAWLQLEKVSLNHPAKLLPVSCPWETVRDNKCLLFQAAKFGG